MELSETVKVAVRFSEVDPIRVVWHGNYLKYMEDAREAFGRKYGLSYVTIVENGYYCPIFDYHVRFMHSASYDDVLLVTIKYKPSRGAKICFEYEIRRERDDKVVLTASTIQLFTTSDGVLEPSEPEFYRQWKSKFKELK
ncbi:putative uncharacterized protein [Bacteroides sp. CAG:545]|nr:putative uncharacterized protein [Bacteroides sp. CAG:545]